MSLFTKKCCYLIMSAAIILGAEEYGAVYDGAQDLSFIDALKLNLKSASASKSFAIDTFVTITGLKARPDLNGKYNQSIKERYEFLNGKSGKVLGFNRADPSRYDVKIEIPPIKISTQYHPLGSGAFETVAIKPDNLQAVATFAELSAPSLFAEMKKTSGGKTIRLNKFASLPTSLNRVNSKARRRFSQFAQFAKFVKKTDDSK